MKGNAMLKLERIKTALVGLKMPRALEIVDDTVGRLERGELSALEAIDTLLAEELTVRESRRVRIALTMARLTPIKTLAGFDFTNRRSIASGFSPWPNSASSIAARRSICSVPPVPARAISPPPSASRRSRLDGPSTSQPWPTSSVSSPKPNARGGCWN